MIDLFENIQIPRNWVVEIDVSSVKFAEQNGYDAMITVFWLYRFGFCADQKINVFFKGRLQKSFLNEEEALNFFKQKYPNSSDFVCANMNPRPYIDK